MDERRAFLKGFLLAAGLAVIFMAGRVSASPGESAVDDISRSVEKLTSEVSDIGDDLRQIRSNGIPVQIEKKFGSDFDVRVENKFGTEFKVKQN
ncbi:MAG: hypothetical protein ACKVQS_03140 [Fimbriimonadaceae bacterium]